VRDVLLEIWQANAAGRYNHPDDRQQGKKLDAAFRGWGRSCSDFTSGVWRFETIKPGAVVGRDGRTMAPHVNLWVVARGINIGLNTRMYFSDEQDANQVDPVLNLIEWEVRRQTSSRSARFAARRSSIASIFTCRAKTKPSSSISEFFPFSAPAGQGRRYGKLNKINL
jgi:protocatechuate 3,4-dioxygenase alpha subunit